MFWLYDKRLPTHKLRDKTWWWWPWWWLGSVCQFPAIQNNHPLWVHSYVQFVFLWQGESMPLYSCSHWNILLQTLGKPVMFPHPNLYVLRAKQLVLFRERLVWPPTAFYPKVCQFRSGHSYHLRLTWLLGGIYNTHIHYKRWFDGSREC